MVGVLQIKREDGTALQIKGSTKGYCALIVALGFSPEKAPGAAVVSNLRKPKGGGLCLARDRQARGKTDPRCL